MIRSWPLAVYFVTEHPLPAALVGGDLDGLVIQVLVNVADIHLCKLGNL